MASILKSCHLHTFEMQLHLKTPHTLALNYISFSNTPKIWKQMNAVKDRKQGRRKKKSNWMHAHKRTKYTHTVHHTNVSVGITRQSDQQYRQSENNDSFNFCFVFVFAIHLKWNIFWVKTSGTHLCNRCDLLENIIAYHLRAL